MRREPGRPVELAAPTGGPMASTIQPAPDAPGVDAESVLEYLVLGRLDRLVTHLSDPRVHALPAWHGLTQRAAAVSFQECVAVGLRDEASVILANSLRSQPD